MNGQFCREGELEKAMRGVVAPTQQEVIVFAIQSIVQSQTEENLLRPNTGLLKSPWTSI